MRASDHDTMYADTFISYLPHNLNIFLMGIDYDGRGERILSNGTKDKILDYLQDLETNEGVRLVLCDTSAVYMQSNGFCIYVE